jgi:hypothetical protein
MAMLPMRAICLEGRQQMRQVASAPGTSGRKLVKPAPRNSAAAGSSGSQRQLAIAGYSYTQLAIRQLAIDGYSR